MKTSFVEKSTFISNLRTFLVRTEGSLLLLVTREHCLVKKSLNSSAFFLKSTINLSLCNRVGIEDIFLLFRKVFKIYQCDSGFVLMSNNLSSRRKYFCLDLEVFKFS